MRAIYPFFLGLAASADSLSVCRMSFLMAASNFLVGTFFSNSLRPFSMRGSR